MNRLERICGKTAFWHEKRRLSIGSSDSKIIMAGDPEALIRLWREKRGEVEPDDLSGVIPVLIGTVTEPLNLALFERETGAVITRDGEQVTHPEFDFMGCTLDGWIEAERAVVECKHVGGFEPWETVIARYMPQIHHQVACTAARKGYFSIIVGHSNYRIQPIEPDPFYIAQLLDRECAFWKCVQTGEPPAPLPPVAAPVPAEAMRVVEMQSSNSWTIHAAAWLETRAHAKRFNDATKSLRDLVAPDVKLAYGAGIKAQRDRRGVTITELQK